MALCRLAADLWICLLGRTMVSQLVKHERIETTLAKVLYFPYRCFFEQGPVVARAGFVFQEG